MVSCSKLEQGLDEECVMLRRHTVLSSRFILMPACGSCSIAWVKSSLLRKQQAEEEVTGARPAQQLGTVLVSTRAVAYIASCQHVAACSKLKQSGKRKSGKPRLQPGALSSKQRQRAEKKKPVKGRSSGRRPARCRPCLPDSPAACIDCQSV